MAAVVAHFFFGILWRRIGYSIHMLSTTNASPFLTPTRPRPLSRSSNAFLPPFFAGRDHAGRRRQETFFLFVYIEQGLNAGAQLRVVATSLAEIVFTNGPGVQLARQVEDALFAEFLDRVLPVVHSLWPLAVLAHNNSRRSQDRA